MLVGNILAVSWAEVKKTAILYGAVGIFHYIFRKKFLAISMNHAKAEQSGSTCASGISFSTLPFGFVVTSSVAIAASCWLLLSHRPSVGAMLFADRHRRAPGHRLDHGDARFRPGCLSLRANRLADGRHHRCHLGGVLIIMFLIHLILHHAAKLAKLEGAASASAKSRIRTPGSGAWSDFLRCYSRAAPSAAKSVQSANKSPASHSDRSNCPQRHERPSPRDRPVAEQARNCSPSFESSTFAKRRRAIRKGNPSPPPPSLSFGRSPQSSPPAASARNLRAEGIVRLRDVHDQVPERIHLH